MGNKAWRWTQVHEGAGSMRKGQRRERRTPVAKQTEQKESIGTPESRSETWPIRTLATKMTKGF